MSTDRRTVLALTGALLAGMAGCTGADPDEEGNDDPSSDDPGNGGDGDGSNGTNGDPDGDENGNDGEPDDGFEDYEVPPFPELDFRTDPDVDEELLAEQIRGNVAFSLDLHDQLREEEPDENLFYSPYSVSVALAMTYAGARAETAEEMAEALRFELGQDDLHPAFGALEAEFARRNEDGETVEDWDGEESDDPGFQFRTANSLWGQEDHGFEDDFLDLLAAYYGAGMELVDFQGDAEAARQRINEWVEERTEDRIEDLLPDGSVDASTKLVLVNAIYFLASWKHEFDEGATEPGTFTGLDGTEMEVELMHQSLEVPYVEIGGHQLVELPYANDDTSMVVIVPAEGEFEAFEEEFSVDRLATLLDRTSTPEVDLALPKFGIESEFSLVDALGRLGMERAFTPGADFSGIDGGGGLFISDVRHKSFVEVDEQGTEAAAATAVIMEDSAPADHVELTVDRPFLFYIRDRPTETPLFVGQVVDGEELQE